MSKPGDGIGVEVAGEFIDLSPSTSITLKLVSPIFTTDNIIPGEYTLPFEVPGGLKSEKNSRIFKKPEVIENIEAFRRVDSNLFYFGIPFKSGKITMSLISNQERYSLNYIFGLSTISEEIKTMKLKDVIGNISSTVYTNQLTKILYCKPTGAGPYSLKVNGQDIEAATLDGLRAAINYRSEELKIIAAYVTSGTTPLGESNPYLRLAPWDPLDPFNDLTHEPETKISVAPVEDTVTEKAKWYIEAADQSDYHDQIKYYLSGFLEASPFSPALRFPFLWNDKTYGEEAVQQNSCVNGQSAGEIVINDANYGALNGKPFEVSNLNTIQPFIRAKYVLDQIADQFGFEWEGDFYEDPATAKLLLWNTVAYSFAQEYIGSRKYIFHKKVIEYADLVPDMTASNFIKALQTRYNLAVYLNQHTGKVRLQKRNTMWANPAYQDLTSISSNIISIRPKHLQGILLRAKKEETDIYGFTDEYLYGTKGEMIIESECRSINQNQSGFPYLATEQLTGPLLGQKLGETFGLRVFHDKGMVDAGASEYYGADVNSESFDEKFTGEGGLFETIYKNYLRSLVKMKEIEIESTLPLRRVYQLDYEVRQRYDRNDYFIVEIEVMLTNKGLGRSKVTLAWI
jgi:hypothetical protein